MCCMCFSVPNEPLNKCRCTFIESYFAYFWPYLWIRTAQMNTLSYECFSLGNLVPLMIWRRIFSGLFSITLMHAHTVIVDLHTREEGPHNVTVNRFMFPKTWVMNTNTHTEWKSASLVTKLHSPSLHSTTSCCTNTDVAHEASASDVWYHSNREQPIRGVGKGGVSAFWDRLGSVASLLSVKYEVSKHNQ